MNRRDKAARILVILGGALLLASAGLHSVAAKTIAFPALASSNLAPGLQAGFRVAFLALAWHWIVIALIALVAGLAETRLQKFIVIFCGLSVLLEAIVGAIMMGLFIGNEMIGSAAILILIGGFVFEATDRYPSSES